MNIQDQVHQRILSKLDQVHAWFKEKRQGIPFPVYSSYDIRDACYKAAVVDANIFPAGFNNICEIDRENAPALMRAYLDRHYADSVKDLLLLTEEHTSNAFYWENVRALVKIIEGAGRNIKVAIPQELKEPLHLQTASGHPMTVEGAHRHGSGVRIGDYVPQLIISNNDFSESHAVWSEGLLTPMNPPRQLGWYQRKKSNYFKHYNAIVTEFAHLLEFDPWLFDVETEVFTDFDLGDDAIREKLARKVDDMIARIAQKYREHGIEEEPFVMVKNNAGTYGLGVVQVRSGEEVMAINYKKRKKMKATKGGGGVNEVIIQEGISSAITSNEETSEPAIYMIGCELAGGFLRAHGQKGPKESLNSPGAVFRRLCVTDLKISVEGNPLENTYGWLARLGLLAIGLESAGMGVEYPQYN